MLTWHSQGALLLQIITKFSNQFGAAIDGSLTTLSTTELYGGARINFIFNEVRRRSSVVRARSLVIIVVVVTVRSLCRAWRASIRCRASRSPT